jgi:hypothetical protein
MTASIVSDACPSSCRRLWLRAAPVRRITRNLPPALLRLNMVEQQEGHLPTTKEGRLT